MFCQQGVKDILQRMLLVIYAAPTWPGDGLLGAFDEGDFVVCQAVELVDDGVDELISAMQLLLEVAYFRSGSLKRCVALGPLS